MITSNGVDSIQLLETETLKHIIEVSISEMHDGIFDFCKSKTSKEMLEAKAKVDKFMLQCINAKNALEYRERGWK